MKNILYICDKNPYLSISGGHQRTNLLCRVLTEFAHVDIVTVSGENIIKQDNIKNCDYLGNFTPLYGKILPFMAILKKLFLCLILRRMPIVVDSYGKKRIHEIIKRKNYDYIIVRYIENIIRYGVPLSKKVIIDIDDLPEQLYQSQKNVSLENKMLQILKNISLDIRINITRKHTKAIVEKVGQVFLANKNQISLFCNAAYLPNIPYPFNSHNAQTVSERYNTTPELLFVGRLDTMMNILGIEYFLEEIWPCIIERLPIVHFNIVGSFLLQEKKEKWETYTNVRVVGFTENIIDEYNKNDVIIAPIYQGAGTNIKVLEAMNLAKPCVITPYACRGFEDILIDKKNILIAKDDIDFIDKVILLFEDINLKKFISSNAIKTIEENFSYSVFRLAITNCLIF